MTGIPEGLLIHTAVVVRPAVTGADSYGDMVTDYGAAATRTSMAGRFQQNTQSEAFPDGRQPAESMWLLFTNESDLDRLDRVEWADHPNGPVTFEIHGRPEPTYDADSYHHTETQLRTLEG